MPEHNVLDLVIKKSALLSGAARLSYFPFVGALSEKKKEKRI